MSRLVSIIMPAYNAETFIGESIRSVNAQTYPDWELIVVNDGSRDNTASIVLAFDDPRIRYVYQENRGLAGARNTGIRAAQGSTIALLDSDDVWEPTFLERMISWLDRYPQAAGVYCGYRYIDTQGEIVGIPSLRVVPPEDFHRILTEYGNWLVPCAVVFRKQLAEAVGLFDESLRAVEDTDLWIRLSERHPLVGLAEVLVRYRRHEANMTKDPKHMVTAARQMYEKHYGSPEGAPCSWPELKQRAYIRHFGYATWSYLAFGDTQESARYFQQILEISPHLAESMALWRSLVRAHLPVEYRHDPLIRPDWTLAQRDIEGLLNELAFRANSSDILRGNYTRLKGSAFLALAEEAVRARERKRAYHWAWRAVASCPALLLARPYWGTIARSIIALRLFPK